MICSNAWALMEEVIYKARIRANVLPVRKEKNKYISVKLLR